MNLLVGYFRDLWRGTIDGWDRFWFAPSDPATLGLIRILAGAMLLYTHAVWTLGFEAFFMKDGWLSEEAVHGWQPGPFGWSHFWWIDSPALLWTIHVVALVVFALLTLGLWTRVVSVLAFLFAVSYVNRVHGALFGLDQVNVLLALYLMIGPSGAAYSLDRLWARWRAGGARLGVSKSVGANVAIRLIQLHLCVIYMFAGLAKLQGQSWWNGYAMWQAMASLEYQSIDMTFMADWPRLISAITHISIIWEVSYCVLVWPRLTRPIVIFLAFVVHLGIGFCLGLMTFGLIMCVANMSFISPVVVRAILDRRRRLSEEQPSSAESAENRRRQPVRQRKGRSAIA